MILHASAFALSRFGATGLVFFATFVVKTPTKVDRRSYLISPAGGRAEIGSAVSNALDLAIEIHVPVAGCGGRRRCNSAKAAFSRCFSRSTSNLMVGHLLTVRRARPIVATARVGPMPAISPIGVERCPSTHSIPKSLSTISNAPTTSSGEIAADPPRSHS